VTGTYELSHLDALEAESVHVFREVAATFERPVLLFSGGKDSVAMLHLAVKAFWPAALPFSVLHVDTGHNFDGWSPSATSSGSGIPATSGRNCGTCTTAGIAGAKYPRFPAFELDRARRLVLHRRQGDRAAVDLLRAPSPGGAA
jgi:hypothetical protein